MKHLILLFLVFLPSQLNAGIEIELAVNKVRDCTLRVTHDAVPSWDTGAIIIKVFKIRNGVHVHCEVQEEEIYNVLNEALSTFNKSTHLKPVNSIMIGRLINFPWMVEYLKEASKTPPHKELSYREAEELVFHSPISEPFRNAAIENGFKPKGASCEKVMYFENGAVKDGLCFLSL
jgi:hypothetical protein